MSYTSGRTVKGANQKTPVAVATTATRQAAKEILGDITGITFRTMPGYDIHRRAETLVTRVTYPAGTAKVSLLRAHIMAEIDTINVVADTCGMTITRTA